MGCDWETAGVVGNPVAALSPNHQNLAGGEQYRLNGNVIVLQRNHASRENGW